MTKTKSPPQIVSIWLSAFLALNLAMASPAGALLFDDNLPKETKLRNLNILSAGAVLAWGVANWDYFQETPRTDNEGWFSRGTDEGGADKLGHLYTTYALSHLYASIYDQWVFLRGHADELRRRGRGILVWHPPGMAETSRFTIGVCTKLERFRN